MPCSIAAAFARHPCRHTTLGLVGATTGPPESAASRRCGVEFAITSETETALPILVDSRRASEMSDNESRPASSNASSMPISPTMSVTTSISHSRKSSPPSSSTATKGPLPTNRCCNCAHATGSQFGMVSTGLWGTRSFAKTATVGDAVTTAPALPRASNRCASLSDARSGTHTRLWDGSPFPNSPRIAFATESPTGPATVPGPG
mmetsp:Transcript_45801/g.121495  ORF Transcript_45801/g.121495 Transcript_45801/m.121495 type:complete len:205 (-) Transcript_45801:1154-1768(-)